MSEKPKLELNNSPIPTLMWSGKAEVNVNHGGLAGIDLGDGEFNREALGAFLQAANLRGVTESEDPLGEGIFLEDVPVHLTLTISLPEWYTRIKAKYEAEMQELREEWDRVPDEPSDPSGFYSEEEERIMDESIAKEREIEDRFRAEVQREGWVLPF